MSYDSVRDPGGYPPQSDFSEENRQNARRAREKARRERTCRRCGGTGHTCIHVLGALVRTSCPDCQEHGEEGEG